MISKIKKPVSILLSLIMVFSVFAIVPLSASATEQMETLDLTQHGNEWLPVDFNSEHFSVKVVGEDYDITADRDGWFFDGTSPDAYASISALSGETITKLVVHRSYYKNTLIVKANGNSVAYTQSGEDFTYDNINASEVRLSANPDYSKDWYCEVSSIDVYYTAAAAHTHDFTYAADGATITATCSGAGDCDITEGLTMTISAPTGDLTADGSTTFPATLSTGYNTTAFPDTYSIAYTKDGEPFDGTPAEAGAYTAGVTVGTATASVSYTVAAPAGETITLDLNADNADIYWDDSTAEDEYWRIDADYDDGNKSLTLTADDVAQAAGTFTIGEEMSTSSCCIIDPEASEDIYFEDGSCTVTVEDGVLTLSGTFTGSDGNTYNVTITYVAPTYTVTWNNWDDTELEKDTGVAKGVTPEYNGATPEKAEDENYTYTFAGWTPEITAVTGDVTYTATFEATEKPVEAVRLSGDISAEDLSRGSIIGPEVTGFNKAGYSLTVNGPFRVGSNWGSWNETDRIASCGTNYDITRNQYSGLPTVYDYGQGTRYTPYVNGKTSNSFIVTAVDHSAKTFTITSYPAPTYTVTWKNDDGTVLETDENVAEGATPEYNGETPTKAEDANNTYTFAGWTPEVAAVTGDATYTATFDATPKAVPAKLILNVGENGKVVMDNGTFGNATDASNIVDISAPVNVTDGSKIFIADDHTANLLEGGSINIATGGEVSFYPSADNTGKITAIPDEDYAFIGWYNGDTLYSSDAALSYQNISEDITLTAKFERELFWKHSVSLGGDIGVNFYLNPAVLDTYTGDKTVTFTWDGNETTVDVPATATADGYKVTCNVVAAQMAHKIHAVVKADGTALAQTDDYSVQDYAETVYANPAAYDDKGKPEQLRALAKALLHYGAMAQTVFATSLKETPDHLADVNMPAADFSGATAENIAAAIKGEAFDVATVEEALGAKFYTSSLIYLSRNTLRLYFTPTTYPGEIPNAGAYNGNLSEYYYYVDVPNIPAAELDDQQTFNVNGTKFTFSALDYAKAVVESKMEPEQQNLAKSLYLYNQAANAYFDAAPAPAENVVDLSTLTKGYEAQDGDVLINALDGQKYIRIADGATVKLRNANITCLRNSSGINIAGLTLLGDATIILEGTNVIRGGYEYCPGIHVPEGKTLTIDGTGSLDVSSNGRGFACGIGSNNGTNCGNIVINGGNITAYAGTAAGIGAKSGSSCGNITINGGTVNATSGDYGAGIGSTLYGNSICGDITINGGVVNATANYEGPGIGSGTKANCGNITITGGTVTAIGGEEGAGIGTGNNVSICGNILITGGTVIAKGGNKAAGIGSGYRNTTCGTITIADTVTQVTATKGTDAPNSIGAGDSGSCGTVTIAPGANVIQN